MTEKEIRERLRATTVHYLKMRNKAQGALDGAERYRAATLKLIQDCCNHKKRSYSGGTPYDSGEWTCDVCGAIVDAPKKGRK